MFKVRFNATVINRDTEEEFHGWVSPEWNQYSLYTEREDVKVTEFDTREEAEKFIEDTIGTYETDSGERVTGHYYAADADTNNETGEDWYRCGVIEEA